MTKSNKHNHSFIDAFKKRKAPKQNIKARWLKTYTMTIAKPNIKPLTINIEANQPRVIKLQPLKTQIIQPQMIQSVQPIHMINEPSYYEQAYDYISKRLRLGAYV